jgi:hypothetical protein
LVPIVHRTGQVKCYDTAGREIDCAGTGQDAAYGHGVAWPRPRFQTVSGTVIDRLTHLMWSRDANPAEWPLTWPEALQFVASLCRRSYLGFDDWRLPNRRELRSLISYQTRKPALPEDHPFENLFLGWYWTSTTAAINPAYAWYLHMEGSRMFYGGKSQPFLVWPVRGTSDDAVLATGQARCYDAQGIAVPCTGTGQDGERRLGRRWQADRFEIVGDGVRDSLTGLVWRRHADLTGERVTWPQALDLARAFNAEHDGHGDWRLPNINELESLVDCATSRPALPRSHPFAGVRDGYWSSTTSCFETDWAWALYTDKGAIGVGQKKDTHFHVWLVAGP